DNGSIYHVDTLFRTAKKAVIPIAVSPHYYYPCDHGWQFGGPLEKTMHALGMFERKGPVTLEGYEGSGADFLERYKPYILDGETIIASPHKVYGPETNDLALQLRKRGVSQVILAGMAANLCIESHLRELVEQGFEVLVVR
ncbi:cysteine hydrolase family protein, partial [Burkholderia ambifaria]|uniref:cysteine hydrolase family protein n=1 Tax=Burkholderia ambifaria TaxID=152480 RepID=UPI00158DCF26